MYDYARSYRCHTISSKMMVYYSDTDSALIKKSDMHLLPSELIVTKENKEFGMIELECEASRAIIVASKTYCVLAIDSSFNSFRAQHKADNEQAVIKVRMKGVRDSDKWLNKVTAKANTINPIANDYIGFFEYLLHTGKATVYTWSFRNMIRDGRLERREMEKIFKHHNTTRPS